MTVEIKRTRLDGAFAQIPKTVRQSYVTVKDVNHVRKRHRSREWVVELTERLNRYCHAADQPDVGGAIRRIEAALRKEYGADEAKKCIRAAYRNKDFPLRGDFLIPRRLWAKTWAAAKEGSKHEPRGIQEGDVRVPPGDINRQLYEIRVNLGKLDRQMENRATESQIRGLIQKVFNDYDVRFGDNVHKLNSRLGHLEESHNQLRQHYIDHEITDAWKQTVTDCCKRIGELEGLVGDIRVAIPAVKKDAFGRCASMLELLELHQEYEHHRHPLRRFPNPLRPIKALVRRLRLTVRVLMRGQEHPFQ
jgi:hypothetical protein